MNENQQRSSVINDHLQNILKTPTSCMTVECDKRFAKKDVISLINFASDWENHKGCLSTELLFVFPSFRIKNKNNKK
jgi:hypothetical protein